MSLPSCPTCGCRFIWCNPITGLYRCGIPADMARAMGIDPVEGCGKTWKDALLQAGKCLDCGGKGFTHNLHTEDGIAIPSGDCAPCAGTGRIIPFEVANA